MTARPLGFVLALPFALASQPLELWAQTKTQKFTKNLVKRAEKSVEEIKKTEKQLEKTVKKYNDLLKKNKVKGRQKEYKKLNDELKKTEKRVAELRKRNDEMQKEANKFFTEWSKGLTKIDDPQLQTAAQENLDRTQSRYGEITAAGSTAGDDYNKFLTDSLFFSRTYSSLGGFSIGSRIRSVFAIGAPLAACFYPPFRVGPRTSLFGWPNPLKFLTSVGP